MSEDSFPQAGGDTTAATLDRERVAQRAYEIYMARGCGEGQELDDWLCAERELSDGDRNRTAEPATSRENELAQKSLPPSGTT